MESFFFFQNEAAKKKGSKTKEGKDKILQKNMKCFLSDGGRFHPEYSPKKNVVNYWYVPKKTGALL